MSADLNVGALSEEDGVLVHLAEADGDLSDVQQAHCVELLPFPRHVEPNKTGTIKHLKNV